MALLISRDRLHVQAKDLAQSWTSPVVTTEYVLLEVANHLRASKHREKFGDFLHDLEADPNTTIIPSDHTLWRRGVDLDLRRPDKDWSLTDYTSFLVMQERALVDALTADHHFEQAGFSVLLK